MDDLKNRPTKKQREILTFIDNFISGHGFGPSYREIARGLGYNSAATVTVHVQNLIAKGHLRKNGKTARSLEVIGAQKEFKQVKVKEADEKWLVDLVDKKFSVVENEPVIRQDDVDELYVLVGALTILEFKAAANSFRGRLADLKKRL